MNKPRTDDRGRPSTAAPFCGGLHRRSGPCRGRIVRSRGRRRRGSDARRADRRHPARRIRAGLRRSVPHDPYAEAVGADRFRGDGADHRSGDRPLRGDVGRGGWPHVPQVTVLRLGDRHPSVPALRARLAASGDIDPNAVGNDIYDSYVEAAVRRFQARHGLTVDGIMREQTLAAINVPAPVRLAQLKVNLTRLRALAHQSWRRATSSPIFPRRASRRSRTAPRCRATPPSLASLTGRRPNINSQDRRDQLQSRIGRCRPSIVQKDLIPKMQDQPDYLTSNHIRIFDGTHARNCSRREINWYSEDATHYYFQAGSRAASIRSARSASIFPAPTASTCTTRR